MKRLAILAYGLVVYALFFGVFLYLIGFINGIFVPRSVDTGGPSSPLGTAILINLGLIALFAIQHTIMARPAFKERWTKIIPKAAERSTFVLVTSAILALTFWQWRPMTSVIWSVEQPLIANALQGISFFGWGLVLLSTFLIDHFDLFGLRQTVLYALGKPYTQPHYVERGLYRIVRHPLMLGFMIAFWSTPMMTTSHLMFCLVFTTYILAALRIEERTLIHLHGDSYHDYQNRVPMIVPAIRPTSRSKQTEASLS